MVAYRAAAGRRRACSTIPSSTCRTQFAEADEIVDRRAVLGPVVPRRAQGVHRACERVRHRLPLHRGRPVRGHLQGATASPISPPAAASWRVRTSATSTSAASPRCSASPRCGSSPPRGWTSRYRRRGAARRGTREGSRPQGCPLVCASFWWGPAGRAIPPICPSRMLPPLGEVLASEGVLRRRRALRRTLVRRTASSSSWQRVPMSSRFVSRKRSPPGRRASSERLDELARSPRLRVWPSGST